MPTSCWPSTSSTVIANPDVSGLSGLEAALGYTFVDKDLLLRALTHKSVGRDNNERLEFLGDAVLGYVVARRLFETRPSDGEDVMTLMRASVVKGETLAQVAAEVGIAAHLRLGVGERRSGGHERASILADALEAVIGAVHEDGGIEPARRLVETLFDARLQKLDPDAIKDPKTRLQERLQGSGLALPSYEVVGTQGADHQQVFSVRCRVAALGVELVAEGSSRRNAEKQAAEAMLVEIDGRV
jgi:ribonuclease-3